MAEVDGMPVELKTRLAAFNTSITDLERSLKPLLTTSHSELCEKLSPLDMAKVDLVAAYAMNSLFWMYLNTCGQNPKEHPVKEELDRMRNYMNRVREITDRAKAPRLDKSASKKFVRNALWSAAQKKGDQKSPEKNLTPPNKSHKKPDSPGKRKTPGSGRPDESVKKRRESKGKK